MPATLYSSTTVFGVRWRWAEVDSVHLSSLSQFVKCGERIHERLD